MIKIIKWSGTAFYITGMLLTSFNFYPINLVFGGLGGAMWCITGIVWKDRALTIVEAASAIIYFSGLIGYLFR